MTTIKSTLLLVASVSGLRGFPQLAGYCASKFAVVGFAEALRVELTQGQQAEREVATTPHPALRAQQVEHTVVGTVVFEVAYAALRRMALEHASAQRWSAP